MTDTTTDVKISVLDKDQLETAFKELCSKMGLRSACVEVEKYDFMDRDRFYEKHDYIWDQITKEDGSGYDDLEVDYNMMFKAEYPSVPDDFPITAELYDLLESLACIENFDFWIDDDAILLDGIEGKTYAELSPEMKRDLDQFWDELELDTVTENRFIMEALNLSEDSIEEQFGFGAATETLAYWTIYYEPRVEDEDAAWRSGLFPFRYDGKFLLALGGCGMDLSPKLDCYQALSHGTIDSGSMLFRQVSYFDYVSHVKSGEILKKVELAEPKVVFTSYGKKN
jgi:hypothetical protein